MSKTLPTTTIAIPVDQINERIVAEVTTKWRNGQLVGKDSARQLISFQFEKAIAFNQARGYALESWQMSSVMDPTIDPPEMIETIVAVFKRDPSFNPSRQ